MGRISWRIFGQTRPTAKIPATPTVTNTALTISGTCTYNAANSLTYSADGQQVTVPITDSVGNECASGQAITIAGLAIVTRFVQTAPSAAALVSVDNGSTAIGSAVNTSSTIALASASDDAVASVSLAAGNTTVGGAGVTTVGFTLGYALANTDTVVFTMPAWFSITNGAITVDSESFAGAGTFTCAGVSATRVITCTAGGAITAGTGNILLTSGSVTALYLSTGTDAITDFAINFVADSGGGADVGNDATVTVTTTVAADANATIGLANASVGATQSTTLTLTLSTALANTDTITFTAPAILNVSGLASAVTGDLEDTDTITCAAA